MRGEEAEEEDWWVSGQEGKERERKGEVVKGVRVREGERGEEE